jgi:3-phenylpropionate/trans-cinnamate dioxygenase ferredoxin subunit
VIVEGRAVAVFNVGGTLYALDAECGHHQGDLDKGEVRDGVVICPKHHAQYRLATGEVAKANFLIRSATRPVHTYRVRSVDGRLALEVPRRTAAAASGSPQH